MAMNLIGKTLLNQYRMDAFVASGGMGAVYRVWDLKRNVPLAMKVLHAELAEDPSVFKRFQREARALQKLAHPNIVPFYGLFQTQNIAFLLERFVDGPTLKDILRQRHGKPLPIEETLVYLKALSAAIGYAHANGVVHCDIKPGNVMIDAGGNVYLTDFGIARHTESTTTTVGTAGTPAYMAPEQIRGEPVTPATDVYALGVMLYEVLTGQRPFRGDEGGPESAGSTAAERIRYANLNLVPPDPRSLNPAISPQLADAVRRALVKQPAGRFQTTQELLDAVCEAVGVPVEQVKEWVTPPPPVVRSSAQPATIPGMSPGFGTVTPRKSSLLPLLAGGVGITLVCLLGIIVLVVVLIKNRGTPGVPSHSTTQTSEMQSLRLTSAVDTLKPPSTPIYTLTPTQTYTSSPTSTPTCTPTRTETFTKTLTPTKTYTPTITPTPTKTLIPVKKYPCVSYYDKTNTALKLACRENNGLWVFKIVDNTGDVGLYTSLAFDHMGNAHISYYDQSNTSLKYAKQNGSDWFPPENVDTNGGMYTSLALDFQDQPAISYYDSSSGELKFAYKTKTAWSPPQIIENIGKARSGENFGKHIDFYSSLRFDQTGKPIIAYFNRNEQSLKFARLKEDGTWESSTVDDDDTGWYCSMALDISGTPVISYFDNRRSQLKFARWKDNNWQLSTVDANGRVGKFTSLVFDKFGNPHISYFDEGSDNLKYASWDGSRWNIKFVQTSGRPGVYTSIALNEEGKPYISYYDLKAKYLKVASLPDISWNFENVDKNPEVGLYTSIAFVIEYKMPTPTPTATRPTATATVQTPTRTRTQLRTPSPTNTPTVTQTRTQLPKPSPTNTPTVTRTRTQLPTPSSTNTPTVTRTRMQLPTPSPTNTP